MENGRALSDNGAVRVEQDRDLQAWVDLRKLCLLLRRDGPWYVHKFVGHPCFIEGGLDGHATGLVP
jgi:hypothetical protein